MQALEWLRRGRTHEAAPFAAPGLSELTESRARRIVLWVLVAWTVLSGLTMIFAQGGFSRLAAGGVKDSAGQRLLGVQFLLLAVVYAQIARRPERSGRGRILSWLPLAGQAATAVVILYDTVAGQPNPGFGSSWPALCIALLFALLLAAFLLAAEPELSHRGREEHETPAWPETASHEDIRTQRLGRSLGHPEAAQAPDAAAASPAAPGQGAPPSAVSDPVNDERVLGA